MASGVISIDRFFGGRSPNNVQRIDSEVINIEGSASKTQQTPVQFNTYGQRSEELTPISVNVYGNNPPAQAATPAQKSADSLEKISVNQEKMISSQKALAGAQLFQNVMNAQNQYAAINESAKANIYLANLAVADAKSRGSQQALQSISQGRRAGDEAKLLMAAQGQDVTDSNVQSIIAGQEAVGVYDAMLAEINASREMLGYELEITEYERQQRDAKYNRNMQIFNSFLSFGAQTMPLG